MNEDHINTSFSFFFFDFFFQEKKCVPQEKLIIIFFLDHHLILSKFCFSITSLILLVNNNNCCWLYIFIFIFSIDDWLSFSMLRKQHYRINQIDQCFIYHHFFSQTRKLEKNFIQKTRDFFFVNFLSFESRYYRYYWTNINWFDFRCFNEWMTILWSI